MNKVFRFLSNKFLLTGAGFVIWMVFFDQNNWTAQEERKKELRETEENMAYLQSQIAKMEYDHQQLVTNPECLERYAREQYKMKKSHEDIYILEE